jgi:hypothetical protein
MKRLFIIASVFLACGWSLYFAAGPRLADLVASRAGRVIARLGEGKVASPVDFVQYRIREALGLSTLLLVWAVVHLIVTRWQQQRGSPRRWRWLTHSAMAFLCLNLWLAQAEKTVLFWGLMWQGKETQNLTRFHIKLVLAREDPNRNRAVLVGSSQTRAQLDEEKINAQLGPLLRTTELHYPGSKGYDVLLLQPVVAKMRPQFVICYVTEAYFHSGSVSEGPPNFLSLGGLRDLAGRGGLKFIPTERTGTGLLGHLLPVFRLRQVLSQRLFGPQTGQLQQQQYNAALETDLAERARRAARDYHINEESRFHQQAFEDFVRRCQNDQQQVILLAGQMNPLFGRAVDPAIRAEMLRFLRELAAKYKNVTLVENLPAQTPADYEDVTHVTKPMQERFTLFFAEWLRGFLAEQGARRR